jgi:phosphatidylglycerophosphatase A
VLLGFGLFRLFDILKPFPIRLLERLKGGWGVVADDLGAGVYALAVLTAIRYLFIG